MDPDHLFSGVCGAHERRDGQGMAVAHCATVRLQEVIGVTPLAEHVSAHLLVVRTPRRHMRSVALFGHDLSG